MNVFSWLMVALPVLFLVALVGYPFFYGIWISLQDRPVAKPGVFIGLANFINDWHDSVFRQVVVNTLLYTAAATILKENIDKMWARCHSKWRAGAVWLVNQDVEPQLEAMAVPMAQVVPSCQPALEVAKVSLK